MNGRLEVRPLHWVARLADILMVPVMYLLSGVYLTGAFWETPQRTHWWNRKRLTREQISSLSKDGMVSFPGNKRSFRNKLLEKASNRFPRFRGLFYHLPILGSPHTYVVLTADKSQVPWHIGWIAGDMVMVSRIPITGEVRMIIGPGEVTFFGVRAETGEQTKVWKYGIGEIGDGGRGQYILLL